MIKKQYIGTAEFIALHGSIEKPDALFYVREFENKQTNQTIRNVVEAKKVYDGWEVILEEKKSKFFRDSWLKTLFME